MKAQPSWGKWLESFDSDGVRRKLSELLQDKSSLGLRLTPAIELERALEERRRRPPLPTGLGALDRLQEGGLPRGSLIEVSGRRSSGRFALALAALAAATAAGEPAALVDPADQLDPEGARSAGVVLERLLWLRPDQPRQTLSCAEALLDAGFALVVLDLGEAPAARRAPQAAWLRLARAARAQHSVMLVVSAAPLCGTAADAQLSAQKVRTLWDRKGPPLLSGIASSLSVRNRRRLGGPHRGLGAAPATDTLSLTGPAE